MKKIENNFTVTGFVANAAEIRQFTTASVARFPLAVSRLETHGEETNRVTAYLNIEVWRKNGHTESFDQLVKGAQLTIAGYFKPDSWVDQQGTKHCRISSSLPRKSLRWQRKKRLLRRPPRKKARNSRQPSLQTKRLRSLLFLLIGSCQLYHLSVVILCTCHLDFCTRLMPSILCLLPLRPTPSAKRHWHSGK